MTNLRTVRVLLILFCTLIITKHAQANNTGCYKSQALYPKLILPNSQTGETKITAMAVLPESNSIAVVGGFTFDRISFSQQEYKRSIKTNFYAFIGCYTHNARWNWRIQVSSLPSPNMNDPYVASLAIKPDKLAVAALFVTQTPEEGHDSYIAEYSLQNGLQTSKAKLKLPTLTWASPQGMLYLDDSKMTLIVVLTTKPNTLQKCVVAAIDFSQQGSAQAKLIQLSDVSQIPTHLVHASTDEFFMASNLDFTTKRAGNSVKMNGLRIVRYKYDSASHTLSQPSGAEKVHITNTLFPQDFSATASPIFTAFRYNTVNKRFCGGFRLRDVNDENSWLFDYKTTDQAFRATNYKITGQQMTVLDCNAEDLNLFFIATIRTDSSIQVVLSQITWNSGGIQPDLTHTTFLQQDRLKLLAVTAGYIKGNNSQGQGFFAVSTRNPYKNTSDFFPSAEYLDSPGRFNWPTAALYYSDVTQTGSCIDILNEKQTLKVDQDPNFKAQQENADTYSESFSAFEITAQVISDTSFENAAFDLNRVVGEDLCHNDGSKTFSKEISITTQTLTVDFNDFALKELSIGPPATYQCETAPQQLYYFITESSPRLPLTTSHYFDNKNTKFFFQLLPNYDAPSTQEFTVTIAIRDPIGLPLADALGPFDIKVIIQKRCVANLDDVTSTQPTLSSYYVSEDGLVTYQFNHFTLATSNPACTFTYELKMYKDNSERSAPDFALNDTKTTFNFKATTVQLEWSQKDLFTSSGNYIFELTGTLPDVGPKGVDIKFTIVFRCRGSPITWVGSNDVFKDIEYSLFDSSTETDWTWSPINIDPPKQIDKIQPSGTDCGPVTVYILNADTTPMDASIFSYEQTSFSVRSRSLVGTATAQTYNLAVFFMYLDETFGNSSTPYYTNKKEFDVIVKDPCSIQTASDVESFEDFPDVKYFFGEASKTIQIASRIQFKQTFCPWRLLVEFLDLSGNPKTKSTAVTVLERDAMTGMMPDKLEIVQESTQPDPAAEGAFKVRVSYEYGYSYSTQVYNQMKQVDFKLELVTCANSVAEKTGLDGSEFTYFLTNAALEIDVSPQVSEAGCAYTVTMAVDPSSTMFTLQSQSRVDVYAETHQPELMARYTVTITYNWNQESSSKQVSFLVTVSDLCQNDVQPIANTSITYTVMGSVVKQSLKPKKEISYCTYVIDYLSGSTTTLDDLVLTKQIDPTNEDPHIKLEQTTYNAATAGEYKLRFRYSWSFEQTREVEIIVDVKDECQTKLQPPTSPIILEYKLLDPATQVDLTPPINSNQYCIFTISLETNPIGSLLTWSNFSGNNIDPIQAQVSASNYVRSSQGDFVMKFNYAWSLNSVASVTVNLKISDRCESVVTPPSSPLSLQYFLMRPRQDVAVAASINSSASYCTYDVNLVSVIKQASSTDVKSSSIWVWTDRANLNNGDAIQFGVYQNPYDSQAVDDYTVKLRYVWSTSNSLEVEINVQIKDDCVTEIQLPTLTEKQYTILSEQLLVDATPSVESSYEFCDYSSRVEIKKSGNAITDPVFSFTSVTKSQVSSKSIFGVQASPAILPSSLTGIYDVKVFYSVSNRGFDQQVTFKLNIIDPCAPLKPVPTELKRQVYKMNAPTAQFYKFSPFTISLSQCTLSYQFSSDDQSKTNLFMTLDGPTQTFKFESGVMTFSHLGEYLITVTGENNSDSSQKSSATFVVEVVKQFCEDTEFRFQTDVFVDKTYDFPLTPVVYQWVPPLVQVVDTSEEQCGPLNVEIVIIKDSLPILLSVSEFAKLLRVDQENSTLTVSSDNNRGDIGTHQLTIKAWYTNYAANMASHSFKVKVDDSICRNSKISTLGIRYESGSDIGDSISYYIDDSPLHLNVNFVTEVKECPLVSLQITSNASNLERVIQIVNYRNMRQLKFSNAPSKEVSLLIGNGASIEDEGTYDITLTATSGRFVSVSFRLQIVNKCNSIVKTPDSPNNLAYTSGDQAVIVTWDPFSHSMQQNCNPKFDYSIQTKNTFSGPNFPSGLIEFQPFLNRMKIHGAFTQSGTYLVQVKAQLNDNTRASGSFEFLLQLTGLPNDHSAILMKPLVLNVPKGVNKIESPKFLADDITSFDIEISDRSMVSYNSTDNSWMISDKWDRQDEIEIEATLIYRSSLRPGLTQSQTFIILLSPEIEPDDTQVQVMNRGSWINSYTPKPGKKISLTPPIFVIENIDSHSFVTLTCNKFLNRTWDWNQTFLDGALNLTIRPGIGQDESNVAFLWDYVNFNQRKLLLRLNFTQPLLISQALTFDFLEVRTNATLLNNLFYDLDGIAFSDNQTLERYIPLQLKQEVATMIISDSIIYVKSTSTVIVIGSFVLNLFLAGSLSFFWGMMNALQFIVHFPLVNVYFPANARLFFKTIITIATFKIFNTEQMINYFDQNILRKVGQPDETAPLFAEGGYRSTSIIRNMGIVALAAIVVIALVLLLLLAYKLLIRFRWGQALIRIVWLRIFWRGPIRYALESYLGFAIATLISYQVQTWGSWSDTLNSLSNIAMLSALSFLPVYIMYFLTKNFGKLESEEFYSKFNALYFNIDVRYEFNVLFHSVFCIRRMIFAMLITLLNPYPAFQIMILLHLSCMTMSYVAFNQPFKVNLLNSLELINEIITLIMTYHLIVFSDFVRDREVQYKVGYFVCAFTAFSITINLIFLVSTVTIAIHLKFKDRIQAWFARRRLRNKQIRAKKRDQLTQDLKKQPKVRDEQFERISARSREAANKILSQDCDSPDLLLVPSTAGKFDLTFDTNMESERSVRNTQRSSVESIRSIQPRQSYNTSSFKPQRPQKSMALIKDFRVAKSNLRLANELLRVEKD